MSKVIFGYKDETVELDVAEHVEWAKEDRIIEAAVNVVFDGGEYRPWRYDMAKWLMILVGYANVDVNKFTLDEWNEIFDTTDLTTQLIKTINPKQYDRIASGISELMDVRAKEHPLKGIGEKLKVFFENAKELMDKITTDENVRKELADYAKTEDGKPIADFLESILNATVPKK